MKTTVIVTLLVGALAAPLTVTAQTFPGKLELRFQNRLLCETLSPDGRSRREHGVDAMQLRNYFHSGERELPPGGYLSAGVDRLYGIERYEVSGLQVTMETAELGASMALFASALGTTFGGWDDDTTWKLVGAAAAAGALWGGVRRADEPGWRVRYRWEPRE